MKLRKLCILALAATLALGGCATRGPQQHEEFSQRQRSVRTVFVVPAEVVFNQATVTEGTQRDTGRESAIQRDLRQGGESKLRAQGYKVNTELADRIEQGDKELAFELEQFKQRYVSLLDETSRRNELGGNPPLVKATVGPQATAWAANAGVDALLVIRYQGFERSAGKAVIDSIPGVVLVAVTGVGYVAEKSGGYLEASLIDAVSGEVIWTNDTKDRKKTAFSSGRKMSVYTMVYHVLTPLPNAAGHVPGKGRSAIAAVDQSGVPDAIPATSSGATSDAQPDQANN